MNFQGLAKVENYQKYLDIAYSNGSKTALELKQHLRIRDGDVAGKQRRVEVARIETVVKTLANNFDFIVKSFPTIGQLSPFYQELVKCTVDAELLKKSLGALGWVKKKTILLFEDYRFKILRATKNEQFARLRSGFYGRTSSVVKQVSKNLDYIEQCRKIMKEYPALKERITIVIAGAPNVGKSTLLARLTGSEPKTAPYPFTTQQLNIGYDNEGRQYVDTPGLLDRPLSERNSIEKQAILALKYIASLIVFVIDPTEICGYTLPEQRSILQEIKETFKLPIILVANKADITSGYKNAIEVSATEGKGIDKLKKEIISLLNKTA